MLKVRTVMTLSLRGGPLKIMWPSELLGPPLWFITLFIWFHLM